MSGIRERGKATRKRKFALVDGNTQRIPDDDVFCVDSATSRAVVRRRLLETGKLPYRCAICPIIDTHNGLPLALHLDHKNGVNNDHRLRNLRWLCPNCHSQTATYAGRNKLPAAIRTCGVCGGDRSQKGNASAGRCRGCARALRHGIEWPSPDVMARMVFELPATTIAKKLGVSDVAVVKFCKKHSITKPGRGYWT